MAADTASTTASATRLPPFRPLPYKGPNIEVTRGEGGVAGGVVAGDPDGHGEGDPVGVEAGVPGGVGFQGA